MSITLTVGEPCPECQARLVRESDDVPWCELCEWNLGAFVPQADIPWPWSWMARADHRLGFRLDERAARHWSGSPTESHRAGAAEWLLRLVSFTIMALVVVTAGLGVWLIAVDFFSFPLTLAGLALIGLAWLFRPRFGRVAPLIRGAYRLTEAGQPAYFGLLRRVSDAVGTKMPDVVIMDSEWNAFVTVVGLRRKRVLSMGLPLWATLRRQERVAVLGHEFGHFVHEDNLRQLLIQPALTTFGRLSHLLRPPLIAGGNLGIYGLFLLIWQILGGLLSGLFWLLHVGANVLGFRKSRQAELHADVLAARLGGTEAAASSMDVMAGVDVLLPFLVTDAQKGQVAQTWLTKVEFARDHAAKQLKRLRQRTKRVDTSLFATHPPAGRRHQFLASLPHNSPQVVLTETEAARIDAELAPFFDHLQQRMREAKERWE